MKSVKHPGKRSVAFPMDGWVLRCYSLYRLLHPSAGKQLGSKREEWSDFGAKSDQSARSVSSSTIDEKRNRSRRG